MERKRYKKKDLPFVGSFPTWPHFCNIVQLWKKKNYKSPQSWKRGAKISMVEDYIVSMEKDKHSTRKLLELITNSVRF